MEKVCQITFWVCHFGAVKSFPPIGITPVSHTNTQNSILKCYYNILSTMWSNTLFTPNIQFFKCPRQRERSFKIQIFVRPLFHNSDKNYTITRNVFYDFLLSIDFRWYRPVSSYYVLNWTMQTQWSQWKKCGC